ncbi:MAG: hypothetical protein GY896_13510 [Gammaproteobacteria bacterium]|nr:hypothetical protein [Gammaproteobacteria bacterium]
MSCKTPGMVVREIWTYLLAYNLNRSMVVQSVLLLDLLPRRIARMDSIEK